MRPKKTRKNNTKHYLHTLDKNYFNEMKSIYTEMDFTESMEVTEYIPTENAKDSIENVKRLLACLRNKRQRMQAKNQIPTDLIPQIQLNKEALQRLKTKYANDHQTNRKKSIVNYFKGHSHAKLKAILNWQSIYYVYCDEYIVIPRAQTNLGKMNIIITQDLDTNGVKLVVEDFLQKTGLKKHSIKLYNLTTKTAPQLHHVIEFAKVFQRENWTDPANPHYRDTMNLYADIKWEPIDSTLENSPYYEWWESI